MDEDVTNVQIERFVVLLIKSLLWDALVADGLQDAAKTFRDKQTQHLAISPKSVFSTKLKRKVKPHLPVLMKCHYQLLQLLLQS